MKCKQKEITGTFKPITLEITIESPVELLDLYNRLQCCNDAEFRSRMLDNKIDSRSNEYCNLKLYALIRDIKDDLD